MKKGFWFFPLVITIITTFSIIGMYVVEKIALWVNCSEDMCGHEFFAGFMFVIMACIGIWGVAYQVFDDIK